MAKKGNVAFVMYAAGNEVYLTTDSTDILDRDDMLLVVIDDDTPVSFCQGYNMDAAYIFCHYFHALQGQTLRPYEDGHHVLIRTDITSL